MPPATLRCECRTAYGTRSSSDAESLLARCGTRSSPSGRPRAQPRPSPTSRPNLAVPPPSELGRSPRHGATDPTGMLPSAEKRVRGTTLREVVPRIPMARRRAQQQENWLTRRRTFFHRQGDGVGRHARAKDPASPAKATCSLRSPARCRMRRACPARP
jgi:hypothetical protein